jgi:deoxyribonuclease V
LPLLAAVLAVLPTRPRLVVIDGYVDLGTEPRPGLGRHLWLALGGTVPVVGVAKTAYAGTSTAAVVRRGRSRQPLHVTAVGIPLAEAAAGVAAMHGADRLPTLLVAVDHAARAALAGR